ncbi:hypothetical protein CerSpe_163940 [Prunus speciosa]
MERIMEVMAIPQDRRVTLATSFFARNARHWWESFRRRIQDPSAITWPVFIAEFDAQFYPLEYQNMKMEEFLQLEQSVMTVLEYEKKFNELSKYCIPLVADERKKCQLFTRGLKASIRDIVISQPLTNFADLVMSASLTHPSPGHHMPHPPIKSIAQPPFKKSLLISSDGQTTPTVKTHMI